MTFHMSESVDIRHNQPVPAAWKEMVGLAEHASTPAEVIALATEYCFGLDDEVLESVRYFGLGEAGRNFMEIIVCSRLRRKSLHKC